MRDRFVYAVCAWLFKNIAPHEYRAFVSVNSALGAEAMRKHFEKGGS